jgi:Spy/CpxP family protein refolding chaperone
VTDRPRALAVLISVFLLGCVLGTAGAYLWLRSHPSVARRTSTSNYLRRWPDLNLTAEQEKQFEQIVGEMRKKLGDLRKEQRPKIEAIRNETNHKLMSILNEEQKKEFESFVKDMNNRRIRSPRGGRDPGRPPENSRE